MITKLHNQKTIRSHYHIIIITILSIYCYCVWIMNINWYLIKIKISIEDQSSKSSFCFLSIDLIHPSLLPLYSLFLPLAYMLHQQHNRLFYWFFDLLDFFAGSLALLSKFRWRRYWVIKDWLSRRMDWPLPAIDFILNIIEYTHYFIFI